MKHIAIYTIAALAALTFVPTVQARCRLHVGPADSHVTRDLDYSAWLKATTNQTTRVVVTTHTFVRGRLQWRERHAFTMVPGSIASPNVAVSYEIPMEWRGEKIRTRFRLRACGRVWQRRTHLG